MTTVAAGILERCGRILVCRRRADQPHALKWEFPGGKVESGESAADALVRELREELAIEAAAGAELMRYEFRYPGKSPILLIFIAVSEWRGEIGTGIFESIAWAAREELPDFDFLEGDERFLKEFIGAERRTERSGPDSASW